MVTSRIAAIAIFSAAVLAGCIQNDEVKIQLACETPRETVAAECSKNCQERFGSSFKEWRCTGDLNVMCTCESYREGDKYVAP